MSQSSPQRSSHETTDSENGELAPVEQPPSGQGPELEEAEQKPEQADAAAEAQAASEYHTKTSEQASAAAAEEKDSQDRRKSKLKAGATKEYRILFNATISDTRRQCSEELKSLAPSQIGASYWTSQEKDAFFTELARCGPGDLRALSNATLTKSEAEVHAYLGLLQGGLGEMNATLPRRNGVPFANVPAAFEIGANCESELDHVAGILRQQLDDRDVQTEKEKHGDYWLIDQACAETIEQLVAQDDTLASPREPESEVTRAFEESASQTVGVPFPSADLLRPEAFLQLSRSLFMNSTVVTKTTWHDLVEAASEGMEEPAIFRTAFDDFYNIAVSLTRRLVQATLFQTMSRLRASDASRSNWQPKAEVTQADVRTTLEILNTKTDWTTYWAELPRKCGLEVYSDSKKYHDGRPGTKNGVKLTYEEVEAELGLRSAEKATNTVESDSEEADTDHMDQWEIDSDMFTLASESQDAAFFDSGNEEPETSSQIGMDSSRRKSESTIGIEHPVRDDAGDEITKVEALSDGERTDSRLPRKRKRLPSPHSYSRAEEQYLEALDRHTSMQEERGLWQVLRLSPPENLDREDAEIPTPPVSMGHDNAETVFNWRGKVNPEAEWEQFDGTVTEQDFAQMEMEGRRGRKRRNALYERLRGRRLSGEQLEDLPDEPDIDESSDVDEAEEEADEESDT